MPGSTRLASRLLLLVVFPSTALAQESKPVEATTPPTLPVLPAPPASSYEARFEELKDGIESSPGRVAAVTHLVLKRDVAEFTLENGQLYLLPPVGGRTVAAVFEGSGRFVLTPPTEVERQRVKRYYDSTTVDVGFTKLALIFTDTTLAELERQLSFTPAEVPGDLRGHWDETLDYLDDDDDKTFDPDVMEPLLNGEASGVFHAHMDPRSGDPLVFRINPPEVESVQLLRRNERFRFIRMMEPLAQFRPRRDSTGRVTSGRWPYARIRHYDINVTLTSTMMGDVGFAAAATLEIVADTAVGPWIPFWFYRKLDVDSARWAGGETATVHKPDDDGLLWVRLDRRLAKGESRTLRLYYEGDLIDRLGDWVFIGASTAWYPRPLEGRSLATFDLTYKSPASLQIASVGNLMDSTDVDHVVTTHWVTDGPIRNASFNIGVFERYRIAKPGTPPVTVLWSERAHDQLARVALDQGAVDFQHGDMKEEVGEDIVGSLRFFGHVFGPPAVRQFYATEIPYLHGEAFPGLVHLSWVTFVQTNLEGADEVFRAHEVAHQWWGIGVDFATYHDQWLSEGLSDFSGLWYMQTARRDNELYFDMLDAWRSDILRRRDEREPIWLGYRTASLDDRSDYSVIVYRKGAWVVHMLRAMMIDLRTMNEDRFTAMMQEFYRTYLGKRASTEDFERIVERHIGIEMDWFFDQWVYGAAIPTYHVDYDYEAVEDGMYRVRLRVRQEHVPETFRMYVPVSIDLGDDRWVRLRVEVTGRESEIELPLIPGRPRKLIFNDLQGVLAEVEMMD